MKIVCYAGNVPSEERQEMVAELIDNVSGSVEDNQFSGEVAVSPGDYLNAQTALRIFKKYKLV